MRQSKTRLLAAGAIILPILAGLSTGSASAANQEADFYLRSAQRLLQNRDLKGAEIQFRNAIQRAPGDGSIRLQLAELYLSEGNANAAEAELIAAKQRGVTDEKLPRLQAEAMFMQGEFGEMLREIPAGNRTPAVESVIRTYRGLADLAIGQTNDGKAMLDDAERLDPKSALAKIANARLLLVQSDPDAAERKIDEVLAADPHNSQALDVKGVLLVARGNQAEALNIFNSALKENPDNAQALLDRANLYIARNELDKAEHDLQVVERTNPASGMAIYLDAVLNVRRGNFPAADSALNKFRSVMDRMPDAYLLAGIVKYNLNQGEQAESYLTRFIARRQDRPQAYQLLGALALRQGNAERAITMLNQALKLQPDNPETIGLLGQAHMARGDSAQALALLDQAVKNQPSDARLRTELAVSRFTSGETGTALVELNSIFKEGSGNALAGPPLVLASLREARADDAAKAAEILVKQSPNNLFYQQLLGVSRVAQRNYPEAEKVYRGILDKQPNVPTVRRNLAEIYLAMNRPADAKKLYQDKLAKDANDVASMEGLADLVLTDNNGYDAAAALLTRAVAAAPADPEPRLRMVNLYRMQKKWPDALNQARAALSAFSGNITVRDILGRTYLESGDVNNSVATYRDAVKAFPNSAPMHAAYATVSAMAKDYSTAQAELTKAISLDPTNDDLKAGLVGIVYAAKGPDAALAQAKTIPNSNPSNRLGEMLATDVLVKSGKRADAIAFLEKAQATNPSPTITLKLASLYETDTDLKRSISILERWTKDHKEDVAVRLQLAQYYGRTRNYPAARTAFEQLANERPSDAIILNNLAWLYGRTNDPKARQIAERAFQLAPNAPQVADTLGWIMTMQGDSVNAMKHLEMALNSMPNDPDVQYHYALALSRNNKAADARVMLQKVLASNADFESKADAQQLLNRLSGQQQPQPTTR